MKVKLLNHLSDDPKHPRAGDILPVGNIVRDHLGFLNYIEVRHKDGKLYPLSGYEWKEFFVK